MADITYQSFEQGRVTNPEQSELIKKRLYDYLLYPLAGTTLLSFFSTPVGQGVTTALGGVVGSAKSYSDTNLEMANTLPSGKAFLIDSIEVDFEPGSSAAANTYIPANVAIFNAVAAAALVAAVNDVNTIGQSGVLELNILSKNYFRDTPINAFPRKAYPTYDAALASNSATTATLAVVTGRSTGRPMFLDPRITLQAAVNFDVKLIWPGVVATPSTFNARMGIILDGFEMRASQ